MAHISITDQAVHVPQRAAIFISQLVNGGQTGRLPCLIKLPCALLNLVAPEDLILVITLV